MASASASTKILVVDVGMLPPPVDQFLQLGSEIGHDIPLTIAMIRLRLGTSCSSQQPDQPIGFDCESPAMVRILVFIGVTTRFLAGRTFLGRLGAATRTAAFFTGLLRLVGLRLGFFGAGSIDAGGCSKSGKVLSISVFLFQLCNSQFRHGPPSADVA